jgi:hypothetical protein
MEDENPEIRICSKKHRHPRDWNSVLSYGRKDGRMDGWNDERLINQAGFSSTCNYSYVRTLPTGKLLSFLSLHAGLRPEGHDVDYEEV